MYEVQLIIVEKNTYANCRQIATTCSVIFANSPPLTEQLLNRVGCGLFGHWYGLFF